MTTYSSFVSFYSIYVNSGWHECIPASALRITARWSEDFLFSIGGVAMFLCWVRSTSAFFDYPSLGSKNFECLRYISKAHLSIAGIMAVDAIIDYNVCSESGLLLFSLPDSVVKIANKFRTKLVGGTVYA
jgi:hypothetical protein